MAFQAPSTGQEKANRKILEQLEEQKKRLRMQTQPGSSGSASSASTVTTPPVQTSHPPAGDAQHMNPAQRAALQHAHANSVGYFITQESSFGNLILPVLPRFESPKS